MCLPIDTPGRSELGLIDMPLRSVPLVTNEIYHLLNRGNGAIPIFNRDYDFQKFLETLFYYQNNNPPLRFSKFIRLPTTERKDFLEKLGKKRDFLVEIVCFCLMPNHFHLLTRQLKENGILNFMRLVQDSYARYFNLKNKRKGSLFENRFKAIYIETDSQLLHVSRYIHLNPYSSHVVKDLSLLLKYPYSSLSEYLNLTSTEHCRKEIILKQFSKIEEYKKFLYDRADYQRSLEEIKHQLIDQ